MSNAAYPLGQTAYLLVDPYNDFLSEGGKVFPLIKPDRRASRPARQPARSIVPSAPSTFRWSSYRTGAGKKATTKTGITSSPSQCKIQHMHHFARGMGRGMAPGFRAKGR
jgi:hypothetical protein